MGAHECRDSLFLYYRKDPPDLPPRCNRCRENIFIAHVLNYKKSGLVMTQHNTLFYEVANLYIKYFMPLNVHNNPLIHTGCSVQGVRAQPVSHLRGSAHAPFSDLFQKRMDIIQDTHALNTDA